MRAASVFCSQIYQSLLPGQQFPDLASAYPLLASWEHRICSMRVDEAGQERPHTRHFSIPHCWQSTVRGLASIVTVKGDVIIANKHELAIVKRGLIIIVLIGWWGSALARALHKLILHGFLRKKEDRYCRAVLNAGCEIPFGA